MAPDEMTESPRPVLRMCIACRQLFPREQLGRVVMDRRQGTIRLLPLPIPRGYYPGRSAYFCLTESCLAALLKGKRMQKTLKTAIPGDILENLDDWLKGTRRGAPQSPNL